jgi:hypothetical protein
LRNVINFEKLLVVRTALLVCRALWKLRCGKVTPAAEFG